MHCIFLDLWDVISLLMSLDMMHYIKQFMTTIYDLNKSKILKILVKKKLVILCLKLDSPLNGTWLNAPLQKCAIFPKTFHVELL